VKKIFGILTVILGILIAFGIVSKRAEANKALFGSGSQDELEMAKRISLDVLRDRAANRAIGQVDEYEVTKVEIDDLKMAHTKVRQTVDGIPVWEGEAIVHLKADGSLDTITDSLKDSIAVNTKPNFEEKQAVRFVEQSYKGKAEQTDPAITQLYIFRGNDRDHLTYRVETPRIDGSDSTSAPVTFIAPRTGEPECEEANLRRGPGSCP